MQPVAEFSHSFTLRVPDNVLSSRVGDDVVVLDAGRGIYYGLNEVAAAAFERLAAGATLGGAEAELAGLFDVPAETLHADLHHLVSELLRLGLALPA